MPRFVSVGECMIEMSGGEDGLYRLGYAGDSFNGAYLAARAQGATPLEAAENAHGLAAIVIGHKGALVPHEKLGV